MTHDRQQENTHGEETQHVIELTERQRKRLNEIKAECKNDHLPEPSDQMMFKSLMDTWDAVNEGLYSEVPES